MDHHVESRVSATNFYKRLGQSLLNFGILAPGNYTEMNNKANQMGELVIHLQHFLFNEEVSDCGSSLLLYKYFSDFIFQIS